MVSSPVRWLIAAPSAKLPSASTTLGISLVPEGRRLFQNLTVAENLQLAARPGGINLTTRSRMLLKGILRAALLRHQQALLGDKLIASKNLAA
jgi:ABC-type sugar transport system ATPase subunit